MKGSLAAMMAMAKQFVVNHPTFQGSLGFLITSGEEGNLFEQGTPYVMSELHKLGIHIDYCVVGEPTSKQVLGDALKWGVEVHCMHMSGYKANKAMLLTRTLRKILSIKWHPL